MQYAEGSGGGAVEALGRPGDPVLLVGEHIQSQEFAAIVHAVPTDGAVAIGSDRQSTITADVDRPDNGRHAPLPELLALCVNRAGTSPLQARIAPRPDGLPGFVMS